MATMEPFRLPLADGKQTSGLLSFPPKAAHPGKGTPLLVTVHGGTYTASYYDADPAHSITNISKALAVPVVSLTRPGYGDSSSLPPLQEGETFNQVNGTYMHEFVLPTVWKECGTKSGASSIVLHSHSIGASVAIVIAALHNRSPSTAGYPLCGLVTSGIGAKLADEPSDNANAGAHKNESLRAIDSFELKPGVDAPVNSWPVEAKDNLMLGAQQGLCSPELLQGTTARINHPASILEPVDIRRQWPKYWLDYAKDIYVPHMYGLGEFDALWITDREAVDAYAKAFTKCVRMEAAPLPMAPHCTELSYMGQAWLARTLGFAMECAVWDALGGAKKVE